LIVALDVKNNTILIMDLGKNDTVSVRITDNGRR